MNNISEAAVHAANDVILDKTDAFVKFMKDYLTWENLFSLAAY